MTNEPTEAERTAIMQLDAIIGYDPEADHNEADRIIYRLVHPEVREAARRLQQRARWWATA